MVLPFQSDRVEARTFVPSADPGTNATQCSENCEFTPGSHANELTVNLKLDAMTAFQSDIAYCALLLNALPAGKLIGCSVSTV